MQSPNNVQNSVEQKTKVYLCIILLQFSFIEEVTPSVAVVEALRSPDFLEKLTALSFSRIHVFSELC